MAERQLVSTHRKVAERLTPEYDAAWERLRAEVGAAAHAWRFRSMTDRSGFVEFLEFPADGDPRRQGRVVEILRELDAIAAGKVEVWTDATLSGSDASQ
jgi:hypothetical protein